MKNVLYLLLLLVGIASGCSGRKGEQPGGSGTAAPVVKGGVVSEVAPASLEQTIELSGTVRARTSAAVAARVAVYALDTGALFSGVPVVIARGFRLGIALAVTPALMLPALSVAQSR